MKKIVFALSAILLLISCSDDDATSETNTNGTRLVKAVYINSDGSSGTSEYFYNGNGQMIKQESGGQTSHFSYTNGLLVGGISEGASSGYTYEYNSEGKLEYQYLDIPGSSPSHYATRYIYNANGTITATYYNGEEIPENIHSITTLYFENGELVKKVMTSPMQSTVGTYTFTFDDKNNPNLNKQGYYGAFFFDSWGPYVIGNAHNLLSVSFESTGGPQYAYHYSYEYDYNSYGYPTQQRQIDAEGNPTGSIINFYYE